MASFSLTEKLAVTGAFLAVVALMVGTEDDPGLVIDGQEAVKELRAAAPVPLAQAAPQNEVEASQPSAAGVPMPDAPPTATPQQQADTTEKNTQFSPELGRVPLDFSNGPPPG